MTRFKRIFTTFSVMAAVVAFPAAANALDNAPTQAGAGCVYTDADGYDIPIDDGQDVFVDGKIVSCRGGTVIITTAPRTQSGATAPSHSGVANTTHSGVRTTKKPTKRPRPKVRPAISRR